MNVNCLKSSRLLLKILNNNNHNWKYAFFSVCF
uniref:Uncharacterized protein n=1 Tax=Lepeophtheirus salmonis TaxID=72036 RepID=A0A0K2TJK5_LEPSM